MPVFDFKCDSCGHAVELFVHRADSAVNCPQCNMPMRRMFPTNVKVHVWPPDGVFLRHVSAKGQRFMHRRDMVRYAREHNLELGALL